MLGVSGKSISIDRPWGPVSLGVEDERVYRCWRDAKLQGYPSRPESLMVELRDPRALTPAELSAIVVRLRKTNMVLYHCDRAADRAIPRHLGRQLGLNRLDSHLCVDDDGVSAIRVVDRPEGNEYIPYTNRPINWHTDGYYNLPKERIQAMLLHCACAAAEGGANALLDHEIAYILMRDHDAELVRALSLPDAMTIPPNIEQGHEIRPARIGPVFSCSPHGHLHMRYTARTRSIEWKADAGVRAAVAFLEALLASESPFIFHHRLEAGQGIICNNVLHKREGFHDDPQRGTRRLIYRARFYDRVQWQGV